MKKLFWLLLLIPISISAKNNVYASIDCQEELTIGSNIDCKLVINNPYNLKIKEVSFDKIENISALKSSFELKLSDGVYSTTLDSSEESVELLKFNFLMDKNNSNILVKNLKFVTDSNEYLDDVSKNLVIENIAYADKIYINNQPIVEIDRDIFNYSINIYERTEYIELKVVTSGNNKTIDENIKLLKYTPTVTFKVTNEIDTETYTLNFNYRNANTIDKIKIKEIPFEFNPNKKYYYLEVASNISKITIENSSFNDTHSLIYGSNNIKFDNDGEIYYFVINRLKADDSVNESSKLRSIKIGNTYLNLKDDVYEYTYATNKPEIVTVETTDDQDYEIKYGSNKIKITVYDAKLNKTEYTIKFFEEDSIKKEVKEYDNSKNIVIFLIFLLSFILISLIVIIKHKKERID